MYTVGLTLQDLLQVENKGGKGERRKLSMVLNLNGLHFSLPSNTLHGNINRHTRAILSKNRFLNMAFYCQVEPHSKSLKYMEKVGNQPFHGYQEGDTKGPISENIRPTFNGKYTQCTYHTFKSKRTWSEK